MPGISGLELGRLIREESAIRVRIARSVVLAVCIRIELGAIAGVFDIGNETGLAPRPRRWDKKMVQIIRATTGIFRMSTVNDQLIERVPTRTIANFAPAGSESPYTAYCSQRMGMY